MNFRRLTSLDNLILAWRRITTGGNFQYKKYFREIYYKYEIALIENLTDLESRLRGGSYVPLEPTRIYIPKPSGLHRPITLLAIEDQIVLQAIANRFAQKLEKKRKKIELKYVFSNILNSGKDSIFFLRDWHYCYAVFQKKVAEYFDKGHRWVAKFDLAAFYDTISYDILLRTLFPKDGAHELRRKIMEWFKCWSAEAPLRRYSHGIPQGPVASDFLAECFLYPVDTLLSKHKCPYLRYVDDIRIFGKTEKDVRETVLYLEKLCRERGVIPQSEKFEIHKAKNLSEILNILPSLTPSHSVSIKEADKPALTKNSALKMFQKSIGGRPQKIVDKTKAKYVLFHAPKFFKILNYALKLLPQHPEHIDAFCFYFHHYKRHEKIIEACRQTLKETPYNYVAGELWHVLARMAPISNSYALIQDAIKLARDNKTSFAKKWGALHFLCSYEELTHKGYSKFLMFQKNALLQALLVPRLCKERFKNNDVVVNKLLNRSKIEVGLMLSEKLARYSKKVEDFGVKFNELPAQVKNTLSKLGVCNTSMTGVDPMAEIISSRFNTSKDLPWRIFMGNEYAHAIGFLIQGDTLFHSGRSFWLSYQDAFNQIVFLRLQELFKKHNRPGVVNIFNRRTQQMIPYGNMLDSKNAFSKIFYEISNGFRCVHKRRNKLPGSHPYDCVTGDKTKHLKKKEQDALFFKLKKAYNEIGRILLSLI